jgi:hypothetical protein
MIFKLNKRIGSMAIVIDEEKEATAFLPVDRIAVMSHSLNSYSGLFTFAMGFGGVDANGKFHLDRLRGDQVANVTINRSGSEVWFDGKFKTAEGNHKMDHGVEFWAALSKEALLKSAYSVCWGRYLKDVEISHDGQLLFKAIDGNPVETK